MRLLADMHIAPRTVVWLRSLGHDVRRVNALLPPTAADAAIVALSGNIVPSVISLRLSSSRVERVNAVLEAVTASPVTPRVHLVELRRAELEGWEVEEAVVPLPASRRAR